MKRIVLLLFCLAFGMLSAATSVSQFTITWTFDADYTVGQYANGDYYVVAPSGLTITNITPASTLISGRTMHGSMINPPAGHYLQQGMDSGFPSYNASKNAGRPGGNDIGPSNPLIVPAGSTVVSVRSHPTAGNRPQFTDGAYLTVVASAPPAGSFRPSPSNPDKTPPGNKSSLDYTILRNLTTVSGAPSLASMEASFSRPWFEFEITANGREFHPLNNQPMYGRDMATKLGDAMLLLHLNNTDAAKEALYIRLVQYGLDVYGAAKFYGDVPSGSGLGWYAAGGFNHGRKAPMILAGMALNNSAILSEANFANYPIFQDDQDIFEVASSDVGIVVYDEWLKYNSSTGTYYTYGRLRHTYTSQMIGLPEWRIDVADRFKASNLSAIYRDICDSGAVSHALMMQLIPGAKSYWNHNTYFDYADRTVAVGNTGAPAFHLNMWTAYRSLGAAEWARPAPVFGLGLIPEEGTVLRIYFTHKVQVGSGGEPTVTLTASGGPVTATHNPAASTPSMGTAEGPYTFGYTLSRAITNGETVTFSVTNGANQYESSIDGADVPSVSGQAVTNHSFVGLSGDTTPPTISITSPTTSPTYAASSSTLTSLSGPAADNVSVASVHWSNDRGGSGTATGTTSWSVPSITLQPGLNNLSVYSVDSSGNSSAVVVLSVTYTAPIVGTAQTYTDPRNRRLFGR